MTTTWQAQTSKILVFQNNKVMVMVMEIVVMFEIIGTWSLECEVKVHKNHHVTDLSPNRQERIWY